MWIIDLLFKTRQSWVVLFKRQDDAAMGEFLAKVAKPVIWYFMIGVISYSVGQPASTSEAGMMWNWPTNLAWNTTDTVCDFVRALLQYRVNVKVG